MGLLRIALKLFIGGYLIYTVMVFSLPFVKFKIYEAAAKKIITNDKDFSYDKIKEQLIKEATDLSIDLTMDNITIEDFEKHIKVSLKYNSQVFLPLTRKSWTFEHRLEENRPKKE
ncbi:MAG: hypothetical protein N3C60_05240 [Calditerrivibrio sp.]|nr:hypothetical protein [Calditerrivibrio sp.]